VLAAGRQSWQGPEIFTGELEAAFAVSSELKKVYHRFKALVSLINM
jgi:hypothetical protein